MSKKTIIIQTSLSKNSRTEVVAKKAFDLLKEKEVDVELINLKEVELPFCEGIKHEDNTKFKKFILNSKKQIHLF